MSTVARKNKRWQLLGWGTFAFFLIKGLLWLVIPAIAAWKLSH